MNHVDQYFVRSSVVSTNESDTKKKTCSTSKWTFILLINKIVVVLQQYILRYFFFVFSVCFAPHFFSSLRCQCGREHTKLSDTFLLCVYDIARLFSLLRLAVCACEATAKYQKAKVINDRNHRQHSEKFHFQQNCNKKRSIVSLIEFFLFNFAQYAFTWGN